MLGIIITIHIIACIGLIFFILIQSGRGGGLVDSFSSAESIFGTKTNTFLTKTTAVFAITFFITCLLLAFLSVQQNKSIVERQVRKQPIANVEPIQETQPIAEPIQQPETETTGQTQETDVSPETVPATE
ncbi:MAG: preprotein translocase subunit SecG [Candidatus Omnitrophica bacterium]|nr:preprotein translocase subunit SecG [Candidatus Omnitrophota bacterium]